MAVVLLALLGCGGDGGSDGGTGPTPAPGTMVVLSGVGQADTVEARLDQPLVLELRNSAGRPAAGVTVHWVR
jgi:hypothetical protein